MRAPNSTEVEALQRRAITGALMAGQSGSRESIAFWRGNFNALQSIANGTAAALANKDARSAYVPASEIKGAWRALANHPEGLSGRRVLEVLISFGIECANEDIAKSEAELARVLDDGTKAASIDLNDKHAACGIDGNDGSGLHTDIVAVKATPQSTFAHTPRPARVVNGQPDALHTFGTTGGHTRVVRHGDAPVIETQVRLFAADRHAAITDSLTADDAEELARALIDAAHDLRSRPAPRALRRANSNGVIA